MLLCSELIFFFYDLVKLFCLFCFYHYMVNKDYHKEHINDKIERDCEYDVFKGHISKPYNSTGINIIIEL